MQVSAIDPVIVALVAALDADVTYPVYDGPPTSRPGRSVDRYAVIGADDLESGEAAEPTEAADMSQEWKGLGNPARDEKLHINCIGVGKARSVTLARANALAVVQDAFDNLTLHPTSNTYNALVSEVKALRVQIKSGGAVVSAHFTIEASARLV